MGTTSPARYRAGAPKSRGRQTHKLRAGLPAQGGCRGLGLPIRSHPGGRAEQWHSSESADEAHYGGASAVELTGPRHDRTTLPFSVDVPFGNTEHHVEHQERVQRTTNDVSVKVPRHERIPAGVTCPGPGRRSSDAARTGKAAHTSEAREPVPRTGLMFEL